MNALRKEAERKYQAALKEWNQTAANPNCTEAMFEKVDSALTLARKEAVAAAMAHPTYEERKRENNRLRLGNRGLEV